MPNLILMPDPIILDLTTFCRCLGAGPGPRALAAPDGPQPAGAHPPPQQPRPRPQQPRPRPRPPRGAAPRAGARPPPPRPGRAGGQHGAAAAGGRQGEDRRYLRYLLYIFTQYLLSTLRVPCTR